MYGQAFSPSGKLLANGDGDGTVRLWNPAAGQPVDKTLQTGSGPAGAVFVVAFSADGELLASGDGDGTVRCGQYHCSRTPMRSFAPSWDR